MTYKIKLLQINENTFMPIQKRGAQFKCQSLDQNHLKRLNLPMSGFFRNTPLLIKYQWPVQSMENMLITKIKSMEQDTCMLCIAKQFPFDSVALFIIRGGVNIGPRRFTIIAELTRAALENMIPSETDATSQRDSSENSN